ncbi:MAG: hypothetical protein ACKV19_00635 [Verrucomicrobiales bacterium]
MPEGDIMNLTDPPIPAAAGDTLSQTKQLFDQAKQDLQSHFTHLKDATRQATAEVQEAAAGTAAAARDGYHALRQDTATQFASYRKGLTFQIREQPIKSVALAALGGAVIGWLVRR